VKSSDEHTNKEMSAAKRKLTFIRVRRSALAPTRGLLEVGCVAYPCLLGRAGIVVAKREGDGGTPRARLRLRCVIQRLDKGSRLQSLLPFRATRPDDAWCDDPRDRRYNRRIRRPPGSAQECLWRNDRLYDVIVTLGWNDGPIVRGRGSAIFWHVCRDKGGPTAGCIAVEPAVFRKVLPRLSRHAMMVIGAF
jgi:L,D-peptidoglycan transpeptidase YkuD (ErfK/YbiS/YcfS/YnhG family)